MLKSSNQHQQGFSALAAVLLVLVVVGVCLIGWYVLKADKKESTANNTATSNPTPPPAPAESTLDPSEDGKYLVITEWGIRFELPKEQQGKIYYTPSKYQADTMILDSRDFPEGAECVSFGITRTTEKVENPTDPAGFNSSSVAKIGQYYYSRGTGAIACSDKAEVHEKAAVVQRQLYDASKAVEAVSASN